jgi:hypothetical protein
MVCYSESQAETINTLCAQNSEYFNVKAGGTYSYHYALRGWVIIEKESNLLQKENPDVHRGCFYSTLCSEILLTVLWQQPFHCGAESSWGRRTQCMATNILARNPERPTILECPHRNLGINWSKYTLRLQKEKYVSDSLIV